MKPIICITATAALLLWGAVSQAKTPSSSFVPRGPEPHSSLSDKHHSLKNKHSAHHVTSKTGTHATHPKSN